MKVIKTEKEYLSALEQLDDLFDSHENTSEGEQAELLMILIEDYEAHNHPIDPPDPIEAIKFRMEQSGMKNKDLAKVIGYKSRVSEVLTKKRKLTLNMIRNLHEKMNIPYESLMTEY
ncbi:HTH-type transcriptional regulator / antitoxin HigA [Ekhidna lutea]|uniref:HTH-type transcriptional regulator / antitoxin HigA n=1 Tax=Ekhidna lutea TaxID=447679 RepID=A0A239EEJ4_EKHLU|nr:transcriptional regulator [Ekhidna lutea]SNS43066.1 HTH-type transcriptional regulator / antitoxin HigA [Ekhidna lutea]